MPTGKICITMPGKIGDAIYALHVARELCKRHGTTCDFYSSSYCLPLKRLFEYQSFVDRFIVPETYVIERMDMGVQPWEMPVEGEYDAVYHLGYRSVPDIPLPAFMARSVGIPATLPIEYEYPKDIPLPEKPYIVLAARGETSYRNLFIDMLYKAPVNVVQIGAKGEFLSKSYESMDATGLDMLETVSLIANSIAFVGLMSSQLCLANGFPIPRIAPHDGVSWDMRHVIRSPYNFYPVHPNAEELLALALTVPNVKLIPSKSLHPYDYQLMDEDQHTRNIANLLIGCPMRFEHPARAWEYGMMIHALRRKPVWSVLDVGGGGSVFAPAMAYLGRNVTQVDPGEVGEWIKCQKDRIKPVGEMRFVQEDFMTWDGGMYDAVTCISTLEHIPDDKAFFLKLLKHAKQVVGITVDFSRDGLRYSDGHLRTYNKEAMFEFIKLAMDEGFVPVGGDWDYDHFGEYVYNYSFASLILEKG